MNPVMVTRTVNDRGRRYANQYVWCPGCDDLHAFSTRLEDTPADYQPIWGFDGNMEKPTFDPSLLVDYGNDTTRRCHSFLKQGMWEFLSDSTNHQLRGHHAMVPLPDWMCRK